MRCLRQILICGVTAALPAQYSTASSGRIPTARAHLPLGQLGQGLSPSARLKPSNNTGLKLGVSLKLPIHLSLKVATRMASSATNHAWSYRTEEYKKCYSDVATRGHYFELPLNYSVPGGEKLEIYAHEVVDKNKVDMDLPWLVYLQGGPGVYVCAYASVCM